MKSLVDMDNRKQFLNPSPRLLAGCSHRNSGETVLLLQMPVSLSKGLWARSFVLYIHYSHYTLYMFLLSYPYYYYYYYYYY